VSANTFLVNVVRTGHRGAEVTQHFSPRADTLPRREAGDRAAPGGCAWGELRRVTPGAGVSVLFVMLTSSLKTGAVQTQAKLLNVSSSQARPTRSPIRSGVL